MSQEDLKINREVRKVLVKHWLDLGRMSIRTAQGKLMMRGFMERIRGVKEDLTPVIVNDIFNRIKRINGITRMTIDIDNWKNEDGQWVKVDKTSRGLLPTSSPTTSNVDQEKKDN